MGPARLLAFHDAAQVDRFLPQARHPDSAHEAAQNSFRSRERIQHGAELADSHMCTGATRLSLMAAARVDAEWPRSPTCDTIRRGPSGLVWNQSRWISLRAQG